MKRVIGSSKVLLLATLFFLSSLNYFERKGYDLGGYRFFWIKSSSMEPVMKMGYAVITKRQKKINIGDIVVFRYPLDVSKTLTHRVVGYNNEEDSFISKGDANSTNDPWKLKDELILGKVIFSIPAVGSIIEFMRKPIGLLVSVILPLFLLIALEMRILTRESRLILKKIARRCRLKFVRVKFRYENTVKLLKKIIEYQK